MEIITSHTNSDFDSLGAMIGARKLYPEAVCVFPGSQEKTLRRFFLESSSYTAGFLRLKDIDLEKVTKLIVVDTDQAARIGAFGALVGKEGVEVHVYDHHQVVTDSIAADFKLIERVGAATTVLAELIKEKGLNPSPEEATMMMIGIFEDTGGLTFTTTTPRDFAAAGYLAALGADLSMVREFVTPEMTADQVALLDELLKNRTLRTIMGVGVTVSSASTVDYVGDLAYLAHKMCDMEHLDALVVHVRMGDRIHMVLRSRIPEFDGSIVARHFGGGGHPEAASAAIHDLTPLEVEEELVKILPLAVRPRRTARDLLSSPAKTVLAGQPLATVRDLLSRYHINALPVTREGRVVGIITRLVVERATNHGLENAPVDEYMTTEFAVLEPTASLEAVRDIITGLRQRLAPVVEEGVLLGVVTRTDLLNAIAPAGREAAQSERVEVRNAQRLLVELMAPELLARVKELGRTAVDMGMHAYLVGGMVRDLLLRRTNLDMDVVVEGDALLLARELALKWDAGCHPHPAFSTAKLKFKDGFELDIASARTEFYSQPAALPTVEQSSLKLDLSRRDFTVNALALRLDTERFGEVIDFFGGLKDIKERSIRILHNLSFVEDPTRILRAVRFSRRFGFTITGQTRRLFKNSIAEGFLAKARGPRLFREWRLLFEETDPLLAAEALMEEEILQCFHPSLRLDDKVRARFAAVSEVVAWYRLLYLEKPLADWKLYMMALLEPLTEEEVEDLATAFGIQTTGGRWFLEARRKANAVLANLRHALGQGPPRDSVIYKACRNCEEEVLLFAMARTADDAKRRLLSRYHTKLAGVRTLLTGSNLSAMGIPPGPVYRRILEGLLDARLDGLVRTVEDETGWVKAQWMEIIEENKIATTG